MLPSTKRNLVLGVFLVIVTLVVLYSYCNGNSVCYTFPLFSGLERDRLVKPEVVVTSVIVQTKRPFHIGEISGKPKGKQDVSSAKHSELHTSQYQHIDEKKKTDFTEEVEKLYFDHNTTSPKTYLFSQGDKKDNITRAKETFEAEKHLLPPSDIIGKVAEEILRRANVSEEEANKELIRVEKVDEIVDKEKRKQEHALLKKVKESRGTGGKNSEKKLVRVERVDLTDDEDEDENIPKKQVHEPEKQVRESDSYERAKSNNASFDGATKKSSRMELGMDSKSEDSESAHARRFGISFAANNTLKNNSTVVKREDKSRNSTSSNAMMNEPTSTLPPFFANFLNVTAKEREMDNLLHNFTNNSKPLDGPEPSISHQGNGTEARKTTMAENIETLTAHAEKVNTREKRNPSETSLLDTLVAKLLNVTSDKETSQGAHSKSKPLDKSFNLSTILEKITEGSQKPLVNKHTETSVPDSTALLVKFLKEGSRYRLRMPHNVTLARADNGNGRIATTKIGNGKTGPQSSVNLKKTLLELANHIDLSRHDNHSETTTDQENKADLVMLKLLLNQSTLQDLTSFNLSRVLKEITGNSLKISLTALQPVLVKRDNEEEDLGPSGAQSDVEIFRPIPDKLETSTPQPVLSTERKPSSSLKGDKELFPAHDSLNTTSVGMGSRKYHASFSSGSGSGEPGNVESERDDGGLVR